MKHWRALLSSVAALACCFALAMAGGGVSWAQSDDSAFVESLARSRAENVDRAEEMRRARLQAEALLEAQQPEAAALAYHAALRDMPYWANGHFNLALVSARLEYYADAITAMRRFLYLAPNDPEARAAQDMIYQWEALQRVRMSALIVGERRSFQAAIHPDQFIRPMSFMGEMGPIDTSDDRADSTFAVVRGLTSTPGAISLESVSYPGRYLRHQGFRLKLHRHDGSGLFRNDASFIPRPGLADPTMVSLESVNYPGFFIRQRNSHLYLRANDGSREFAEDATFRVMAPNLQDP